MVNKKVSKDKKFVEPESLKSTPRHFYPMNLPTLDIALGGGIPSGRIIELFGRESTGKSTMAVMFAFAFIDYWKAKGEHAVVLWIETETVFDEVRLAYMDATKPPHFVTHEMDVIEDVHMLIRQQLQKAKEQGIKLFVVWDTIASAQTLAQKTTGDKFAGGQGEFPQRVLYMMKDLTGMLGETDSTFVVVNQIRKSFQMYTEDESPGGSGMRFYPSIRIRLSKLKAKERTAFDGTKNTVGVISLLKTVKNKVTLPEQKIPVTILGELGLDRNDSLCQYLKEKELLKMSGSWVSLIHPAKPFAKGDEPFEPTPDINSDRWKEHRVQGLDSFAQSLDIADEVVHNWIEYLVYNRQIQISPLLKIRVIEKIWQLEKYFFGQKITKLTDREQGAVKAMQEQDSNRKKSK